MPLLIRDILSMSHVPSSIFDYCCPASCYRPLHGPIFFMDLVLDKEGCHYSTDLPSVQPTIVAVFDRGIQATHSVPQIEKVLYIYSSQAFIYRKNSVCVGVCVCVCVCVGGGGGGGYGPRVYSKKGCLRVTPTPPPLTEAVFLQL